MTRPVKDNWVDVLLREIATGKNYKRLIQKCINNMGERKKLYKYYDLSSPYTLSNLENATNYYNNPTAFNDPFDCNIGISSDQLIRLCLPDLYDKIFSASLDPTVRAMINTVIFGDSVPYEEGSDESIIAAFLDCPDIAEIVHRAHAGEQVDDAVLANAILSNPDILAVLLRKYPELGSQENNGELAEQIRLVAMSSTKFVRQILNKEATTQAEEVKEIMSIMSEDEDLLKRIQKIARLLGHTEQDEQIEKLYKELEIMVKQLHAKLGEIIGITCFSETPTNMLMWSHYANKHTGICVEYDFSELFTTAANTLLLPVTYTNKRPLFPVDKIAISVDGKVIKDQSFPPEALPEIIKAFTVKSNVWSYEREWRHIIFTNTTPNRIIKLPIISKIILGINISPEDREKVINIARKLQIPVYATRLKADKYEMVIMDSLE